MTSKMSRTARSRSPPTCHPKWAPNPQFLIRNENIQFTATPCTLTKMPFSKKKKKLRPNYLEIPKLKEYHLAKAGGYKPRRSEEIPHLFFVPTRCVACCSAVCNVWEFSKELTSWVDAQLHNAFCLFRSDSFRVESLTQETVHICCMAQAIRLEGSALDMSALSLHAQFIADCAWTPSKQHTRTLQPHEHQRVTNTLSGCGASACASAGGSTSRRSWQLLSKCRRHFNNFRRRRQVLPRRRRSCESNQPELNDS